MSSPPANQLGDDGLGDDANASSSGASSAGPGAPWVSPGRKSVLVPLVGTDHNGVGNLLAVRDIRGAVRHPS